MRFVLSILTLTCTLIFLSVFPTVMGRGFSHKRCSAEQIDKLIQATRDAAEISHLTITTLDAALDGHLDAVDTDTLRLVERWFGTDALPSEPEGFKILTHIRGLYRTMYEALQDEPLTYHCAESCSIPGELAHAGTKTDWLDQTLAENLAWSNLTLCPLFFATNMSNYQGYEWISWHEAIIKWQQGERNDSVGSPARTILHELAHDLAVGKTEFIPDMCIARIELPDWVWADEDRPPVIAYGYMKAQLLAIQSTTLALHNAENYGGFALEVALRRETGLLPPQAWLSRIVMAKGGESVVHFIKDETDDWDVERLERTVTAIEAWPTLAPVDQPLAGERKLMLKARQAHMCL